jgi:hypothetical protein
LQLRALAEGEPGNDGMEPARQPGHGGAELRVHHGAHGRRIARGRQLDRRDEPAYEGIVESLRGELGQRGVDHAERGHEERARRPHLADEGHRRHLVVEARVDDGPRSHLEREPLVALLVGMDEHGEPPAARLGYDRGSYGGRVDWPVGTRPEAGLEDHLDARGGETLRGGEPLGHVAR